MSPRATQYKVNPGIATGMAILFRWPGLYCNSDSDEARDRVTVTQCELIMLRVSFVVFTSIYLIMLPAKSFFRFEYLVYEPR